MSTYRAQQGSSSDPASTFTSGLIAWQKRAGRHDLPWQNTRDAYRIWLSEIMLQQTQVSAVIGYYRRFLDAFPSVAELARATIDEVMPLWSGLGYYARARNVHACARQIVARYAGVFPTSTALLEELPGIGRSTAAAIAVFSAGERAAILDGNVKRVLCRAFGIAGYPGERAVQARLWALAEELLPTRDLEPYTQGLMDFGATICTPRNPRCASCFFQHACIALREDRVATLPERKPRRSVPEQHALLLVLHHAGRVLLEKRPARGVWGALWSLPQWNGQGDALEQVAKDYARRHGKIAAIAHMAALVHGFTHFRLVAGVLAIDLESRTARPAQPDAEVWLALQDAASAALPAPIKRMLVALWRVSPGYEPGADERQTRLF